MPIKRVLKSNKVCRILFSKWIFVIVGILVMAVASYIYPMHQDEEVFLSIATSMVAGDNLYKDIFDNKPPGIYLTAIPFIFTEYGKILWLRAFVFIIAICSSLLLKNITGKWVSFSLFLVLLPYYQGQFFLTEVFVVLFLLLGLTQLLKKEKERGVGNTFWAGFWVGCALLFKQTAIINGLIYGAYIIFLRKKSNRKKNSIKDIGIYLSGIAVPIGFIAIWLQSQGVLTHAWNWVVIYNLFEYTPDIFGALCQIPVISAPIVVIALVFVVLRGKTSFPRTSYEWFLLINIMGIIPVLLTRAYHHYWLQVLPFVLLYVINRPISKRQLPGAK